MNAGIKEFNLKSAVLHRAFLPNKLIHSGFSDFARAVISGVDSVIISGQFAIEYHPEVNRLTTLRRSKHHVQVATVEAASQPFRVTGCANC